jgi:hypothetical protein
VLAGGKAKWRRGCGVVKSSGGLIGRHASFPRTGTWISTRIYFLRTSRERRHSHWALPVWTMAVSIYNPIFRDWLKPLGAILARSGSKLRRLLCHAQHST